MTLDIRNWRLIALDLDGTCLHHGDFMADENKQWLKKARDAGIEFTFATGRHRNGVVRQLVEELGVRVPFVTMNGSEVWDPDGTLLARHTLAVEQVTTLHELATTYHTHFWAGSVDGPVQEYEFPSQIASRQWLKFGFYSENEDVIRTIWMQLQDSDLYELTNSHPLNIEVNPKGVSKASGLEVVSSKLGITSSQVITMGDSLNDVSMLEWAGLGIAMGNAQETVKAHADFVTCACDEHGVAYAIEQLLAGKIG